MTQIDNQYRQTLTQLAELKRIFRSIEHVLKNQMPATLLITSAVPGEGKSLFSAALASTAAKTGKYRVAALDMNWYRPAMHRFFDLDLNRPTRGFLDATLSDLVCCSGQDFLDVVTAPAGIAAPFARTYHSPPELNLQTASAVPLLVDSSVDGCKNLPGNDRVPYSLNGEITPVTSRLIDQAMSVYDLAIIDGGSIFPTNRMMMDPVMLASIASGVVLVVLAAATPRQTVKKALTTLDAAGANVLGVITNQWKILRQNERRQD